MITGMKFKIEGKAVTYHITASSVSSGSAFGVKRGIIYQGAKVVANNVYNALMGNDAANQGLLAKLNNDQKKLVKEKSIKIANEWDVKFLGDANAEIRLASIVNSDDIEKSRMPMSKTNNTSQVNVATETKSPPDVTAKEITVPGGTPILQAVNQIILQSDFLTKALTKVYKSDLTPDPKQGNDELVNDSKNQIKWYTMTAEITNLGWDTQASDFAYRTTYVIQTYDTPIVLSAYAKKLPKYYGPHKRYEYWFTGKNSEIISYEQSMDNTYMNVALDPLGDPQSQGNGNGVATMVNKQTNQERTGRDGKGNEAQNTYMTSLFDPGSWNSMKMTILGDPDYLTSETPESANALYQQFYKNDGFTINPNGGQVFIEIAFNEGVDYDTNEGIISVNDSIYFVNYPPEVAAKIKGISYTITEVESIFAKGKFTQVLTGLVNDMPAAAVKAAATPASDTSNQSDAETNRLANAGNRGAAATNTSASPATVTGLTPDAPVGSTNYYKDAPNESSAETARLNRSSAQQTVPTNNPATPQVQDDDAAVQAGATQAGQAMSAEDAQRAGA
jgi:hypothetical protein